MAARVGHPGALDQVLVERLTQALRAETHPAVLNHVLDALAHSADRAAPAALLGTIPSASPPLRERLVEAAALFAQLVASRQATAPAPGRL
jgi:hypothetical protein